MCGKGQITSFKKAHKPGEEEVVQTNPKRAAEVAHVSAARRLTYANELARWSGLTVQHFQYDQLPDHTLRMPPILEDVITIQTTGSTALSGRIGRPFARHLARPGDIMLVPRGEPSEWKWTTSCEVLCLFPAPSTIAGLAVEALDAEPAQIELRPHVAHRDPLVQAIGTALMDEFRHGHNGALYAQSLATTLVLHLLHRYAAVPKAVSPGAAGLSRSELRRVKDYIEEHLAEELHLRELAGLVHMSSYHFARKFRRATGQPVHQYVITKRVERAKELLRSGLLTATEVSAAVGFHDLSHLNRHFKRLVSLSPSHYAALHKNVQGPRKDIQAEPRDGL